LKVLGVTDSVTGPQLSNEPLSTSEGRRVPVPVAGLTTRINGFTFTTGLMVSRIVTRALHVAELEEASLAVSITDTGVIISAQLKMDLLRDKFNTGVQLSDDPLYIAEGVRVALPVPSR